MHINIKRLKKHLLQLAEIGKEENGGVTRRAYSREYYDGIKLVKEWMQDASLDTFVDSVGNVLGVKKGRTDRILLIGSHTDTVEHGGIFDGCLGVLGGIEALMTIEEENLKLEHTIIVANWAEEEGNTLRGLIGSGAFVGQMDEALSGMEEKMKQCNITVEDVKKAKYGKLENIDAYLELHIEQGGILDQQNTNIGIVNSIVGEDRYLVTINGKENHAGTTPMIYRDDALVKAANIICRLNQKCKEVDETMVCTTGYIKAYPGEQNIIPGKVELTVEMRASKNDSIIRLTKYLKELCGENQGEMQLTLSQKPTQMASVCMNTIREACEDLNVSYMTMQSGAGHDAMMIATVIENTGMIFVPSINGVSHCPQEQTEWKDVENGADVLLQTILRLDKNLK